MPRQQVTAHAAYEAPQVIVVTVFGPQGTATSETVGVTQDVAAAARRQAHAAFGDADVDLDLRVAAPSWLAEGDLVRLEAHAVDADDLGGSPYGRIVGFLPVGGVLVTQARAGTGVFAPEDMVVVRPEDVDQEALADIWARTGPASPDVR